MNVNINNKNLFSQSLLINKFFFQKKFFTQADWDYDRRFWVSI